MTRAPIATPRPSSLPIEARDGTRARAVSANKADWFSVKSADGHIYWFPPGWGHLAVDGMTWERLEALLRQALAEIPRRRGRPPVDWNVWRKGLAELVVVGVTRSAALAVLAPLAAIERGVSLDHAKKTIGAAEENK